MSAQRIVSLLLLVFALQVGLPRAVAAQSTAEIVIEWNRILRSTFGIAGALTPTLFFTPPHAMLHVG